MSSVQTRLSWAAVGMVVSFNLFCWLPASIWAFVIIALTGLTFLLATRVPWLGVTVAMLSVVLGLVTARFLPSLYSYYFAVVSLVFVVLPALLIAIGMRRGLPVFKTQLLAIAPISITMILYMTNIGNIATDFREALGETRVLFTDWYEGTMKAMPNSASQAYDIERFGDFIESSIDILVRFFPGLMVCWVAVMNITAHYLTSKMVRRDGGFCQEFRSFVLWKAGNACMVVLAFALLLWVTGVESLRPISENLLLILGISYMIVGFALLEYYLKRLFTSSVVRVVLYILLTFFFVFTPLGWIGGLAAAILGLIDSHFDFRRVKAQQIG